MADEFLDVGSFKTTSTGKKFFVKLGSAKAGTDGKIWVEFDALPLPNAEGRCTVVIAPRQKQGYGSGDRRQAPAPRASTRGFQDDSEIPF